MAARRRKAAWPDVWRIALLVAAGVVVVLAIWFAVRPGPRPGAKTGEREFGDRITALAEDVGAPSEGILADESIHKIDGVFVRRWRLTVPDCGAARRLAGALEREAAAWGGTVRASQEGECAAGRIRVDLGTEAFDLHVSRHGQEHKKATPTPQGPTATPTLPPDRHGRLAILLDDAGQNLNLVSRLERLPSEIAVAVLPFLPASSETAGRVFRAGHEVWLHLPMEPEGYPQRNPGPGAVLTSMSEAEIRATVRSALNNVPHVVGVNNHEGSKATANLRLMTWVMQELAARNLAFIDSRTTKFTVAEDAARAQGIHVGRRHVFLDNRRTPSAVRKQLDEAVYLARRDGFAIAIGHCNAVTISVLEDEAPRLWKRKVKLVAPTKLLR